MKIARRQKFSPGEFARKLRAEAVALLGRAEKVRRRLSPSLCGTAWITRVYQHTLDPEDPWRQGYRMSDTWPNVCV